HSRSYFPVVGGDKTLAPTPRLPPPARHSACLELFPRPLSVGRRRFVLLARISSAGRRLDTRSITDTHGPRRSPPERRRPWDPPRHRRHCGRGAVVREPRRRADLQGPRGQDGEPPPLPERRGAA